MQNRKSTATPWPYHSVTTATASDRLTHHGSTNYRRAYLSEKNRRAHCISDQGGVVHTRRQVVR